MGSRGQCILRSAVRRRLARGRCTTRGRSAIRGPSRSLSGAMGVCYAERAGEDGWECKSIIASLDSTAQTPLVLREVPVGPESDVCMYVPVRCRPWYHIHKGAGYADALTGYTGQWSADVDQSEPREGRGSGRAYLIFCMTLVHYVSENKATAESVCSG